MTPMSRYEYFTIRRLVFFADQEAGAHTLSFDFQICVMIRFTIKLTGAILRSPIDSVEDTGILLGWGKLRLGFDK
jgi:hypothetical protein